MAWHANQVFAQPKPSVISALCSVRSLSDKIYHIKGLSDLQMPPNGLLVIREICGPRSAAAEWYHSHNQPIASWNDIIGPIDAEILSPKRRPQSNPPLGFLRFLKWVSQSTQTVTSFYYCHTGGSSMGPCFSWVFDAEDVVYVYNNRHHETIAYCTSSEKVFPVHQAGGRNRQIHHLENNVLPLTLEHHGLHLGGFYFAPHTARFEWEKHKLAAYAEGGTVGSDHFISITAERHV